MSSKSSKTAPATAITATDDEGWLPTQIALRNWRDQPDTSLRQLGRDADVPNSSLSTACTQPGYELNTDSLAKLFDHVPGLREAAAEQVQAKMQETVSRLGLAIPQPAPKSEQAGPQRGDIMVDPARLYRSPFNPRKTFDEAALQELADSIGGTDEPGAHGVLQNLTVRPRPGGDPGDYEIIFGERRWRACCLLVSQGRRKVGEAFVPVKIGDYSEGQARAIAILENLQRVDVSPLEEAEALDELTLMDPDVWTTGAIAKAIGKDGDSGQRYVLQRLALARQLGPEAKDALRLGLISFEKARFLCQKDILGAQALIIETLRGGDPDLGGLFTDFSTRARAIADSLKPPAERAPPAEGTRQNKAGTAATATAEGTDRQYSGAFPAQGTGTTADAIARDDDLVAGLPDPDSWVLATATPNLLTISLVAPSQEAFDAAMRLFRQVDAFVEAAQ